MHFIFYRFYGQPKHFRFFALLLMGGPEEGRWVWFRWTELEAALMAVETECS